MDQNAIDDCIRRVRNARNVGMMPADIIESMGKEFSTGWLFLAWQAACILDPDVSRGEEPTDKVVSPPTRKVVYPLDW